MRIVVAMSGGVDSSVAAALLAREGHDVIGVTLQVVDLSDRGLGVSRCCSPADAKLAADVARRLGIGHRLLDVGSLFQREVLDPFVRSYAEGRTPSPCIRCNSRVKFGALWMFARGLGAEALATGHYARTGADGDGNAALWRGRDRAKDQSYFLFELSREQLGAARFPLGVMAKDEVRALAHELGFTNAGRGESQDMCFIPPGRSYADVLERLQAEKLPGDGEIVDRGGAVLGAHRGVHRFTVGQRRGLGVAGGRRLYVIDIDAARRRVVVGEEDEALRERLHLHDVNWLVGRPDDTIRAEVQVRSRHVPAPAAVRLEDGGTAEVSFDEPVLAPAPGQAAVCYEGDRVLGGGWIASTA